MKIAILGTRGIPNHYGGFEQCAEYLALGLVRRGHEVIVYNSHNHPYQEAEWNNVKLIHIKDPERTLGTAGQFIYDLRCILDVRKQNCDVVLQLGYTSSSIWGWLMPQKSVITTNMDGLEWKRTKYGKNVQRFLQFAESCGVRYSDHLISDSIGIQQYLKEKYKSESTYIPYGANPFTNPEVKVLEDYALTAFDYDLLIARLEPENSIEIILDGVVKASVNRPFLVIGDHMTKYGEYLKAKYKDCTRIRFTGGIYKIGILNNLRYFSNLYFHGHTVGGTNPSLLEAMASNSLISANNNPFNRYILGEDAFYFDDKNDVAELLRRVRKTDDNCPELIQNNMQKIRHTYTWDNIIDQYESHFYDIVYGESQVETIKLNVPVKPKYYKTSI
jgi:glycosyltransferase involved in cell wall biosynthesis